MSAVGHCFVVMGFGIKTDYATGRKLDLDKSYKYLIKPVVERQRLTCIRADEIRHSGNIDVPMYRELLTADVVIADLSTANPNAFYELGIRHALRPRTTIVISEDKLPFPFDLNHVNITRYTHLGEDIGAGEVERFSKLLESTLEAVLSADDTDSPVYTFLQLKPPTPLGRSQTRQRTGAARKIPTPLAPSGSDAPTLATLVEGGERALDDSDYGAAREIFAKALQVCPRGPGASSALLSDSYLRQRLVLATYKPLAVNDIEGLEKAMSLLAPLQPDESNDPETIGLAGAIEKRLFEATNLLEHLERAIRFRARGYYLRDDLYHGTSLALLLNVRANTSHGQTQAERTADLVYANRVRGELLVRSKRKLQDIHQRQAEPPSLLDEHSASQAERDRRQEFWCHSTDAAAYFGKGNLRAYEKSKAAAARLPHASWMMRTLDGHIAQLEKLLAKQGYLLDPPWPGARAKRRNRAAATSRAGRARAS